MLNNPFPYNKFKILCWNAQSILNKTIETFDYIKSNDIDIALFTETWLQPKNKIFFPNYLTYRLDRKDGSHGGVAISIKNNITHKLLPLLKLKIIEALAVNITTTKGDITIVCVYFPGTKLNSSKLNNFKADLKVLTSYHNSYFVVGDLNSKHRLWNNLRANQAGKILYELMSSRNFIIHNPTSPTFYPSQKKYIHPSTIDIVITNNHHPISQIQVNNSLSSDHRPIIFDILIKEMPLTNTKKYLKFSAADWRLFQSLLNDNINLLNVEMNSTAEIDHSLNNLLSTIKNCIEKSVPMMKKCSKTQDIPPEIKILVTNRNNIRRQWQRYRYPIVHKQLKLINKRIKLEIYKLHNSNFNRKIKSLKPSGKQFWKFTKILKNSSNISPPLVDNQNNSLLITNEEKSQAIANEFAKSHLNTVAYHSNLENVVNKNNDKIQAARLNNDDIQPYLIKPIEIKTIIKSFKNKKAPGKDQISNITLKHLPKKAIVLLTKIFNSCLNLSYFPSIWKISKVIPIPKPNKNQSIASNYRPITLLDSCSKIFEKLILKRLKIHTDEHNIIPVEQFGFREHHSTTQQLARVIKNIKKSLKNKKSIGMVILDIEKAFDCIWHKALIYKMKKFNFPIILIKMIQSFINNRTSYVQIQQSKSNPYPLPAGVPQGSSLSPMLYNIFTADIPIPKRCDVALFADDTAIYKAGIKPIAIIKILENSLRLLNNYFSKWKIKLNGSKSQAIFFTNRRARRFLPDREIRLQSTNITWSNEVKYLGLLLDKKLLFKNHIDYTKIRAQKYIKIFYPLINKKSFLNIHNKLLVLKVIFRPMMLYAGEIWGDCAKTHLKQLQITQNKILKLIFKKPFFYSTKKIHNKGKIMNISETLQIMKQKFIEKCYFSDYHLIFNLYQYNS